MWTRFIVQRGQRYASKGCCSTARHQLAMQRIFCRMRHETVARITGRMRVIFGAVGPPLIRIRKLFPPLLTSTPTLTPSIKPDYSADAMRVMSGFEVDDAATASFLIQGNGDYEKNTHTAAGEPLWEASESIYRKSIRISDDFLSQRFHKNDA